MIDKSIALKPNEGFAKFMSLAQLQNGMEAVVSFTKGIEIIKNEINQAQVCLWLLKFLIFKKDDKLKGLKKSLTSALVSISEIYMTDLWFVTI